MSPGVRPQTRFFGGDQIDDFKPERAILATMVARTGPVSQAAFVAGALLLLAMSPPASAGLAFADELRTWRADSTGEQATQFLRLQPGEGYSTYVFHVEPGDDTPVAAALVEVRNLDGSLECRGFATYTLDTLNALHYCPELRVGHHYELDWTADRPGTELILSGTD